MIPRALLRVSRVFFIIVLLTSTYAVAEDVAPLAIDRRGIVASSGKSTSSFRSTSSSKSITTSKHSSIASSQKIASTLSRTPSPSSKSSKRSSTASTRKSSSSMKSSSTHLTSTTKKSSSVHTTTATRTTSTQKTLKSSTSSSSQRQSSTTLRPTSSSKQVSATSSSIVSPSVKATTTSRSSSSRLTTSRSTSATSKTISSSSTATATNCPNFYDYKNYQLISLNKTDTNFTSGFYGARDSQNLPSLTKYMAIWTAPNINAYAPPTPDTIYDISNPGLLKAIYPNGTHIIIDSSTGLMTVSNCVNETTFPVQNATNTKRHDIAGHQNLDLLDRRQIPTSVSITVVAYNECGNLDPAVPRIYCQDTTEGQGLLVTNPMFITNQKTIAPGTVTATCNFIPPDKNLGFTASCLNVVPTLEAICETSDSFNPQNGPSAASVCTVGVLLTAVLQPEFLLLLPVCKMLDNVNKWCEKQDKILPTLKDALCGKTPAVTEMTISIWDPAGLSTGGIGNSVIIGTVSSNERSPGPVYYEYHRPPPYDAVYECTDCVATKAGQPDMQTLSMWTMVFHGGMNVPSQSDFSQNCMILNRGVPGATSVTAAIQKCEGFARSPNERNRVALSYSLGVSYFYYTDTRQQFQEGYRCTLWDCHVSAAEFTEPFTTSDFGWYYVTGDNYGFDHVSRPIPCFRPGG